MAVDFDKFTHRSQQATLRAQELAKAHDHQYVEPTHLLTGLLDQSDGIVYPLFSKLGVRSPDAVYVGDSPIDIEAGRAAGVHTIGVLTGTSSRETLAAVSPDRILKSAAELEGLLSRPPGNATQPDGSTSPESAA